MASKRWGWCGWWFGGGNSGEAAAADETREREKRARRGEDDRTFSISSAVKGSDGVVVVEWQRASCSEGQDRDAQLGQAIKSRTRNAKPKSPTGVGGAKSKKNATRTAFAKLHKLHKHAMAYAKRKAARPSWPLLKGASAFRRRPLGEASRLCLRVQLVLAEFALARPSLPQLFAAVGVGDWLAKRHLDVFAD